MKKNSSTTPRTEAQIAASRVNGAKSRGPVTPEGRARSSQNNLKHGLRSSRVVLSNESLEKYNQLLSSYLAEWNPATQSEHDLLLQMVNSTWQLRRIEAIEASILDTEMFLLKPDFDQTFTIVTPTMRQADGTVALAAQNPALLDYLQKAHSRLARVYERALRTLFKLQTSRLGHEPVRAPLQPENSETATAEPNTAATAPESNCQEPEVFAWVSAFIPNANRPIPNRAAWLDLQDVDDMKKQS